MEEIKYTYHFSLFLNFKNDVDVDRLEKYFKIDAYKKTFLRDSKGPEKTAKIWYKTKEISDVYTDEAIERFILQIYDNFANLKQILKVNNGSACFTLYFTDVKERPVIGLTLKTIEMLEKLGLSFDVDFSEFDKLLNENV